MAGLTESYYIVSESRNQTFPTHFSWSDLQLYPPALSRPPRQLAFEDTVVFGNQE